MTFLGALYTLAIEVLTFWMPIFYSFKFLMDKNAGKVQTILKFWCMISFYSLLSVLLNQLLDDNIFPIVNLLFLIVLNLPPYEITEKIYNATLGTIYTQNKKTFETLEQKIVKIFDKNAETLKNRMKDSTGQKLKGMVGQVLMATIATSAKMKGSQKKSRDDSDNDSENPKDD